VWLPIPPGRVGRHWGGGSLLSSSGKSDRAVKGILGEHLDEGGTDVKGSQRHGYRTNIGTVKQILGYYHEK